MRHYLLKGHICTLGAVLLFGLMSPMCKLAMQNGAIDGLLLAFFRVSGAALLRLDALQFDEYNRPYVETGSADAPRRVDVQVGVSDGVYCQILSGVQAGDTVLKPSGMSMMELMIELDQKTR